MALKTTDKPQANPSAKSPLNPEEKELARKHAEQTSIQSELAERELRSANLRAELGAFEQQYLHFVGSRYAELDELKAGIAERAAKEHPENARAQQAAHDARERAKETKNAAGEKLESSPRAFESSPEAKRQMLMAEANEAYQRGDEAKLTKILTEYEWSPEQVQGEGAGAELIRVIR